MNRTGLNRTWLRLTWGVVLAAAAPALAEEPEAAGVVRIAKPSAADVTIRAQSPGPVIVQTGATTSYSDCPYGDCPGGKLGKHGWGYNTGDDMLAYFQCKFGFLMPTGCGGAGCPPFGKYARVYPQNVQYHDQRDGQLWAAQGYGVPVAVPLAPVVGHQYNYGWGTPSSRLTPISRVAPY